MERKLTKDLARRLGRTYYDCDTLWLSYSASGAEWICRDAECIVRLVGDALSGDPVHSARYAIEVNGVRVVDATMGAAGEAVHALKAAEGTELGTVRVLKLSECADSVMGIASVECETKPEPTEEKVFRVEFVGDSITCGYGVDGVLGELYSTSNEDATKAYAYLTARELDVDYSLVSFSGYGIISGYTELDVPRTECLVPDYYRTMGNSYGRFGNGADPAGIAWDFDAFSADVVVINLGTNDASYCGDNPERQRAFIEGYKRFLRDVRECNRIAVILCTLGIMDDRLNGAMETAVEEYAAESGDEYVRSMLFAPQDMEKDGTAVDWHPSAVTHRKAADRLIAYMRENIF
jgi:GDSL-like Lipase/Acylhydrolase.